MHVFSAKCSINEEFILDNKNCRYVKRVIFVGNMKIMNSSWFLISLSCSLRTSWSTSTLPPRALSSSTSAMPSSCPPTDAMSTSCLETQSLQLLSSSGGRRCLLRQTCGASACWPTSCSVASPHFWTNHRRKPASTSAAWTSASRTSTSVMWARRLGILWPRCCSRIPGRGRALLSVCSTRGWVAAVHMVGSTPRHPWTRHGWPHSSIAGGSCTTPGPSPISRGWWAAAWATHCDGEELWVSQHSTTRHPSRTTRAHTIMLWYIWSI